jgi:glutamate--cysteine ligase catalytic subunit
MEVQMTDFENAAFAVFIVLLSRAILSFNLNFYIPISKVDAPLSEDPESSLIFAQVDENMARAQKRDAAVSGKFYFRKDVYAVGRSGAASTASSSGYSSPICGEPPKKETKMRNCFPPLPLPENGALNGRPVDEEYEEMTMNEIINGKVRLKPVLVLGLERLCRVNHFPAFWVSYMRTLKHWTSRRRLWPKLKPI